MKSLSSVPKLLKMFKQRNIKIKIKIFLGTIWTIYIYIYKTIYWDNNIILDVGEEPNS